MRDRVVVLYSQIIQVISKLVGNSEFLKIIACIRKMSNPLEHYIHYDNIIISIFVSEKKNYDIKCISY